MARALPNKKRLPNTGYSATAAIPRPLGASTSPDPSPSPSTLKSVSDGIVTPVVAPRVKSEPSPKLLVTEPPAAADEIEELEKKRPQDEDSQGLSEEREGDIYADAALSCSIENKEECMMCSG